MEEWKEMEEMKNGKKEWNEDERRKDGRRMEWNGMEWNGIQKWKEESDESTSEDLCKLLKKNSPRFRRKEEENKLSK